jgi:predicted DNA-binding protein (MmcQ/YjbR family)
MHVELLRDFCIAKAAVTEHFPFDEDTLVFKVAGKMFSLVSLSKANSVNLKCDPERVEELRNNFEAVKPGFHMSKTHWNTVYFNQDVSDALLLELVTHSYNEVVKGLTKKVRAEYGLSI